MTEPDRIGKLEIHLGNLSSRFDALEGRIVAVETQVDEVFSSIQRLNGRVELLAKNLTKVVGLTESNVRTSSNISESVRMLNTSVTMLIVLDKMRNGEDADEVITALPDEKLRRTIRKRLDERRKQ